MEIAQLNNTLKQREQEVQKRDRKLAENNMKIQIAEKERDELKGDLTGTYKAAQALESTMSSYYFCFFYYWCAVC